MAVNKIIAALRNLNGIVVVILIEISNKSMKAEN